MVMMIFMRTMMMMIHQHHPTIITVINNIIIDLVEGSSSMTSSSGRISFPRLPLSLSSLSFWENDGDGDHDDVVMIMILMTVIGERPKSPIEKIKRNLKSFSPVSREETETGNSFHQFREEKEKSKRIFSTFERRKRNWFSILKLQEKKEKGKTISPFSRREGEISDAVPQFWEEKEK